MNCSHPFESTIFIPITGTLLNCEGIFSVIPVDGGGTGPVNVAKIAH
jgi:hypothetical protein